MVSRVLSQVILDDGHNDKIRQFLSVSPARRRRSSVSADQLLLKQIGPTLGFFIYTYYCCT